MMKLLILLFVTTAALAGEIVTFDESGKSFTRHETEAEAKERRTRSADENPPPAKNIEEQISTLASNQVKIADALRRVSPATTNDLATIPTASKSTAK